MPGDCGETRPRKQHFLKNSAVCSLSSTPSLHTHTHVSRWLSVHCPMLQCLISHRVSGNQFNANQFSGCQNGSCAHMRFNSSVTSGILCILQFLVALISGARVVLPKRCRST